ncbi:MAG: hypothetical protein U5N55_03510 [Cypionkella sp.]|nr:hypothetical protein [Cypionkella sp.]
MRDIGGAPVALAERQIRKVNCWQRVCGSQHLRGVFGAHEASK